MTPTAKAHRDWALTTIDRLMAPGIKLTRDERTRLINHRTWLGEVQSREPAEWCRDLLRRLAARYLGDPRRNTSGYASRAPDKAAPIEVAPRWQPGAPIPSPPKLRTRAG
jgi:hypothetical protein